jgi:hypothetical protein
MIEKGDRKDNLRLYAVLDEIDVKKKTLSVIIVGDASQPNRLDEAAMLQASVFRLLDVRKREQTTLVSIPVSRHAKITDGDKMITLGDLIEGKAVMLQLATDQHGLVVIAIQRLRWDKTSDGKKS